MSVQLILKNSSVADKRPTADQLVNGELSLNYNAEGAFLCCVDTAGNIQQVGGVKLSTNPPGDPVRGTMWLDTTDNSLFVFDGSNWVLIAGGTGGGGGGTGDITSVIGGDGINTVTGSGIVTVSAELNTDQGLHFVSGEIAVNPGANLSFDAAGRLQADVNALSYKGTVDMTAASVPTSPSVGDVHGNTENGVISAEWSTATGMALSTTVVAGDLVAFNGTDWGYIPTGGLPGQGADLGVDDITATTLDVTSSSGTDATIPAATNATAGLQSAADKAKLDGIADGAEANIQADWLEADAASDAFIRNKPAIAAQVQSDWDQPDELQVDFIRNKPTIPAAQVQSNWDETDTLEPSFIQNKPTNVEFQADWDETDTDSLSFIQNKPADTEFQSNWSETDTASLSFIQNKPTIPAAPVQSDWNETDTGSLAFIKNKPGASTIGDGQINFNAGNGLTSTGDNATANQSGNTTKTFTVQAANNTINVGSGGISVNQTELEALYLLLAGGNLTGGVTQTERTITAGAFDLSTGNFWTCGGIAIPNPTNAVAGMSGLIRLTGTPTSWGGNFSTAPDITVNPSIVPFYVESATSIRLGRAVGVN